MITYTIQMYRILFLQDAIYTYLMIGVKMTFSLIRELLRLDKEKCHTVFGLFGGELHAVRDQCNFRG